MIDVTLQYLFDTEKHFATIDELAKVFHLPQERKYELKTLQRATIFEQLDAQDIEDMLATAFGLSADETDRLAQAFVGHLILPLAGVDKKYIRLLTDLGGKVSDYPAYRVSLPTEKPEQIIEDILKQKGGDVPEDLKNRFTILLKPYVLGQKSAEVIESTLARDTNTGGMAFSPEVAKNIIKAVDDYLATGVRVEGVEYPNEVILERPTAAGPNLPVVNVSREEGSSVIANDSLSVVTDQFNLKERVEAMQEVKELPPLAAIMPSVPAPSSAIVRLAPTQSAQHALATSIPVVNGEFMTAAESTEIDQHKVSAQKAVKQTEPQVEKLSMEAEQITEKLWPQVKETSITKTVLGQLVDTTLRGVRSLNSFERTLRDTHGLKFEQIELLTGAIMAHMVERDLAMLKKQHADEKVQQQKVDLAQKEEAKKQALIDAPLVAPALAKAEVSTPTVHKTVHGTQKVTDIIYKKQTLGPIDELGTMSIGDFRILASRPQDLLDVVLEKIAVIAQDGYEERLKAVQAWKQSPVNLMYVRLLRDAIRSQRAIPEIIAEIRGKGEEVLSPAEVEAVMAINKRLQ